MSVTDKSSDAVPVIVNPVVLYAYTSLSDGATIDTIGNALIVNATCVRLVTFANASVIRTSRVCAPVANAPDVRVHVEKLVPVFVR